MSETAWLLLIGALLIPGTVVFALLWRHIYRLTYVPADPPPPRPRDPALVAVADELRAQGLTSPAVPRAIAARAPSDTVHARDSPPFPEGARDPKRYDVN